MFNTHLFNTHQSHKPERCPRVCLTVPVLPLFLSKTIPSPLNHLLRPWMGLGHGVSRFTSNVVASARFQHQGALKFLFRFLKNYYLFIYLLPKPSHFLWCRFNLHLATLAVGKWRQCLASVSGHNIVNRSEHHLSVWQVNPRLFPLFCVVIMQ